MQILLAEDNETNRKVAMTLTQSLGHEVDCVENGFEAVEQTKSKQYDVILMDVQMPVVDGLEATRRIRQLFKDSDHMPRIIAVTANVVLGERQTCLKAGMDDYIVKPLRMADLKQALELAEAERSCSEGVMLSSDPDQADTHSSPASLIDHDQLLSLIDPDDEECLEILDDFCGSVSDTIEKIQSYVETQDWKELAAQGHQLKGSSATLGFIHLSSWAGYLETSARNSSLELSENWRTLVEEEFVKAREEANLALGR